MTRTCNEAALHSIDAKIQALTELRGTLDHMALAFAIVEIEGAPKLVVAGIGKSGHIARKLVATFQSTGQPAVFLHPSEAAHGDMGLIGESDVILLLSNSGETDELVPLMDFAERHENHMIMITSRPTASLAQRCDNVLGIPRAPEGCPVSKAPMASTTCQLAIGDALAAGLMVARGFTADMFAELHHGGYLGKQARTPA